MRGIIYDVYCTTDKGERIIVEMQNRDQTHFIDRTTFYIAFDCFIYTLKNMEILDRMPFMAKNAVFKKLAEIADVNTLTQEEPIYN